MRGREQGGPAAEVRRRQVSRPRVSDGVGDRPRRHRAPAPARHRPSAGIPRSPTSISAATAWGTLISALAPSVGTPDAEDGAILLTGAKRRPADFDRATRALVLRACCAGRALAWTGRHAAHTRTRD